VRSDEQAEGAAAPEYAIDADEVRYLAGVTTVEDFVRTYHPFVGEASLLFPADGELTVGDERGLAILLAGGEVALRARCKATEMVTRQGDAPGLGAIRARVIDVEPQSRIVYHELLEAVRRRLQTETAETPPLKELHDLLSSLAPEAEELTQKHPGLPAHNEFVAAVPTRENLSQLSPLDDASDLPSEPTLPTVPSVPTAVAPVLQVSGTAMVPEDMTLVASINTPILPDADDSAPRVLAPAVVAALNTIIPNKPRGGSLTARVTGTEEATRAAPLTSSALASLSMRALADAKVMKPELPPEPVAPALVAPQPAPISAVRRLVPVAVACLISFGVGFYLRGTLMLTAPMVRPAAVVAPAVAAPVRAIAAPAPAVAKPAPTLPVAAPAPPTEVIPVPPATPPGAPAEQTAD
jgi:hypothetical protein